MQSCLDALSVRVPSLILPFLGTFSRWLHDHKPGETEKGTPGEDEPTIKHNDALSLTAGESLPRFPMAAQLSQIPSKIRGQVNQMSHQIEWTE